MHHHLTTVFLLLFFKYVDYAVTVVPIVFPFAPFLLVHPFPPAITPLMSMGCACKFFGFFISFFLFFKRFYLFIFREGKGGRKRGKYQFVVASCAPPTGDLAHNPGMCPDQELNQ